MMENTSKTLSKFYEPYSNTMSQSKNKNLSKLYESYSSNISQSKDNINKIFNLDLEPIFEYHHYLCPNCLKFPFIEFCKDRKNIRLTCSCININNKKILIKELLDKINNFDFESSFISLNIENKNNDKNFENELICKEHNKKFKYFSKFFLQNYCEYCEIDKNNCIRFDDIKI